MYGESVATNDFKDDEAELKKHHKTTDWDDMEEDNMDENKENSSPNPISDKPSVTQSKPSGYTEITFNAHLAKSFEDEDESELEFVVEDSYNQKEPYRYMNNRVASRAEALEQRLEELQTAITTQHKVEPTPFNFPTQDDVIAVGRVASEEAQLDETCVVLESNRQFGKARVKVLLNEINQYSLFPGQIIGSHGFNPTGKLFIAKKFYELAPLPFYQPIKAPKFRPFNVLVASGPWTSSDNLEFSFMQTLLQEVQSDEPNLLILIGPFIDEKHPQLQPELQTKTYQEVFMEKVYKKLRNLEKSTKTILVPSLRDLTHNYYVYPQPPFHSSLISKLDGIESVSNPCTMLVNGVSIGVTSHDIIKQLAAEEISRSTEANTDRIGRLCGHIVTQRSFHPMFPPAQGVPLDTTNLHNLELQYTPDIMIVPSDLACFVKNVHGCLFVNPGRVGKGKSSGTFARFTVHMPDSNTQRVAERTRVDVVRL